jgi:hypothetical protein
MLCPSSLPPLAGESAVAERLPSMHKTLVSSSALSTNKKLDRAAPYQRRKAGVQGKPPAPHQTGGVLLAWPVPAV